MRTWNVCALIVLLLPLTAPEAVAQSRRGRRILNADSLAVHYAMDPIVVTAAKDATRRRELAASVSLIGIDRLTTETAGSVFEAVQHRIPGLFVTEWGAFGYGAAGQAAGKISIRGTGGGANTNVLILRNGRPDFMGLMGCTIADEFSTDGVERIEVVRGPGSFLYGTNATGGIINIIPRRLERDGFETRLGTGYGSFDTRRLSLSHGGRSRAFDYYLTVSDRRTDGHRTDSDYTGRHYTAHAGWRFSPDASLEFNANLADLMLRDPGPVSSPRVDNWYDLVRSGGDLTLDVRRGSGELVVKAHANFGSHRFFDGWRSKDRTHGLMAWRTFGLITGNATTIGFDIKRYGGRAHDAGADYGEHWITEYAPYLHLRQLVAGRFILDAGLRSERHSLFGSELLPKLGLVTALGPAADLRLSLAKGFRSPSIRELYLWAPANADLGPDRLWNAELGLIVRPGERLRAEAVLFRSRGSNLIQFSGPPPRWINGGSYVHNGYEILLDWVPVERVTVHSTWSDIDLSDQAYNIPARKLTLSAGWEGDRLAFSGTLVSIMDMRGSEWGAGPVPRLHDMDDYAVLDLSAVLHPVTGTTLRLTLRNVFDTFYEAMWGYPMPGRQLVADVTYAF